MGEWEIPDLSSPFLSFPHSIGYLVLSCEEVSSYIRFA